MKRMRSAAIVLASGSPRRKQLLEQIDLEFLVIPSQVHEDFDLDLSPEKFVEHYAKEKAKDIAKAHPDKWIIGADTIVVFNAEILGKPKDREDSFRMLKMLSGNTHQVFTGVSIQQSKMQVSDTFDKAGSYGIQDWFSVCVNHIDGCFYNVMGFPLSMFYSRFSALLKSNG